MLKETARPIRTPAAHDGAGAGVIDALRAFRSAVMAPRGSSSWAREARARRISSAAYAARTPRLSSSVATTTASSSGTRRPTSWPSCPRPATPRFVPALRRLIRESRVDLVIPTIDRHVQALSDARARLPRPGLPAGRPRHRAVPRQVPAHDGAPPARRSGAGDVSGARSPMAWTRSSPGSAVRAGSGAGRGRGRARAAGRAVVDAGPGAPVDGGVGDDAGRPGLGLHARRVPARARDPLSERVAARPDGPRQHVRAAGLFRRRQYPERRDLPVVTGEDGGRAGVVEVCRAAIAAVAPGRLRAPSAWTSRRMPTGARTSPRSTPGGSSWP